MLIIGASQPMDSKEHQNNQKKDDKEAGAIREVYMRVKPVEDRSDDCGGCLASISTGADGTMMLFVSSSDDDSEDDDGICDNLELRFL